MEEETKRTDRCPQKIVDLTVEDCGDVSLFEICARILKIY